MNHWKLMITACLLVAGGLLAAQEKPKQDARGERLRDPDQIRVELPIQPGEGLERWRERKERIRRHVLIKTGLWPAPERTPLNPVLSNEQTHDGFRVASVHFESLPGFLVTGNLFRPVGSGPFPAVLNPHGHWEFGRLQNGPDGSIPARCIELARQGYVALAIDMVGYNDSFQLPHDRNKSRAQKKGDQPLPYEPREFRGDFDFPLARLHGLNLAGLQLWNSIRAVDFLEQLPEVDARRIAVTGASGGATQSLLLMAADDRIAAAAPVNIIGMTKHPGCRCENPPGLWAETSTVELAAAFAPRPLILVSAGQDPWTHATPEREYPLIRSYYRLEGAEENVHNVHIEAGHNFNAESRGAVYEWFRRHLGPPGPEVEEPEAAMAIVSQLGDLRVFPDRMLPENAVGGMRVVENWIDSSRGGVEKWLESSSPETVRRTLAEVLLVDLPAPADLEYEVVEEEMQGEVRRRVEVIGRRGAPDRIELESVQRSDEVTSLVLLVYPDALGNLLDPPLEHLLPARADLLAQGAQLFRIRGYASGRLRIPLERWEALSWPQAYNRLPAALAIQDAVTALASVREFDPDLPLTVIGLQEGGVTAAFAATIFGGADRVLIDLNSSNPDYEGWFLRDLPAGALLRVGGFGTAAALLMERNLLLFNGTETFPADRYLETARRQGAEERLTLRINQTQLQERDLR